MLVLCWCFGVITGASHQILTILSCEEPKGCGLPTLFSWGNDIIRSPRRKSAFNSFDLPITVVNIFFQLKKKRNDVNFERNGVFIFWFGVNKKRTVLILKNNVNLEKHRESWWRDHYFSAVFTCKTVCFCSQYKFFSKQAKFAQTLVIFGRLM